MHTGYFRNGEELTKEEAEGNCTHGWFRGWIRAITTQPDSVNKPVSFDVDYLVAHDNEKEGIKKGTIPVEWYKDKCLHPWNVRLSLENSNFTWGLAEERLNAIKKVS